MPGLNETKESAQKEIAFLTREDQKMRNAQDEKIVIVLEGGLVQNVITKKQMNIILN